MMSTTITICVMVMSSSRQRYVLSKQRLEQAMPHMPMHVVSTTASPHTPKGATNSHRSCTSTTAPTRLTDPASPPVVLQLGNRALPGRSRGRDLLVERVAQQRAARGHVRRPVQLRVLTLRVGVGGLHAERRA
eukprot:scaffold3302_cov335-Prasinococcus_capsulatus_cf.AAC.3